jgi:hypothetical protein
VGSLAESLPDKIMLCNLLMGKANQGVDRFEAQGRIPMEVRPQNRCKYLSTRHQARLVHCAASVVCNSCSRTALRK